MSLIERAMQRSAAPERKEPIPIDGASALGAGESVIEAAVERAAAGGAVVLDEAASFPAGEPLPAEIADDARREPTFRSQEAAGSGFRLELDLERLKARGVVTPDAEKSAVFEEFRIIKRPLITNATGRGASNVRNRNLIMVTSALPGEGKTFCSINLAMSIAIERDHTVLLVDADVARPSIHQIMGFPQRAGLLDVVVGDKQLGDVILNTTVEKLRILPAGRSHRHATELLASEAMAELLDELSTRYSDRIIVFDSPPLLATSEARVIASQMGQVVIVVEAQRTTQRALQDALREVESCEIVGLIYNKSAGGGNLYGYYNYAYGYGYGYARAGAEQK